jgi:hypothetical protein
MHNLIGNQKLIIILTVALLVVLFLGGIVRRFKPANLNVQKFQSRWVEIEQLCAKNDTWPLAIINADTLLDEVLKQRRCKGKTMGERLVAAQHDLSSNDTVWFGHKLRNKIVHEEMSRLYRKDVQAALRGFRDALKDLGALK